MRKYTECSDYATDSCPCVLAESGHCIVCSMCRGEEFCSCGDTVSFCVYQELLNNGGKAREARRAQRCEIISAEDYDDVFRMIKLRLPDADLREYMDPGAFVLVRMIENTYYYVPLSVLCEDGAEDVISLLIHMRGIKTKCFRNARAGDTVWLRGPYFNGIQGKKAVSGLKDGKALVLCRGIGLMPSLHVVRTLLQNRNRVEVYLDRDRLSPHIAQKFSALIGTGVNELKLCDAQGDLTEEARRVIDASCENGAGLIHLGMSDHLIGQFAEHIENIGASAAVSFPSLPALTACRRRASTISSAAARRAPRL